MLPDRYVSISRLREAARVVIASRFVASRLLVHPSGSALLVFVPGM